MTDITKLAEREKFEAWWEREYKHLESSKYTDAVPHIKYGFWMAYQAGGAELLEALEKAQQRITQMESRTVTVKLPSLPYLGAKTIWYQGFAAGAEGMRNDCAHAITAAGIKVEAE